MLASILFVSENVEYLLGINLFVSKGAWLHLTLGELNTVSGEHAYPAQMNILSNIIIRIVI